MYFINLTWNPPCLYSTLEWISKTPVLARAFLAIVGDNEARAIMLVVTCKLTATCNQIWHTGPSPVHPAPQQELIIPKPGLQSSCTSWFLLRLTTCSRAWDYGTIPSNHHHKSNIKRLCALQPPDPTCKVHKITLMMCEHYSRQLYWDFIKRLKHWYSTANKPPSQREDLSLVTCKSISNWKKLKTHSDKVSTHASNCI